jgi:acyl-CoA thioester hydrolase
MMHYLIINQCETSPLRYVLPIRVNYEDTDLGGIVYHANYLKFFERGRVEALRSQGIELSSLLKNHDAQFAVRSVKLDFFRPARLDQLLYVVTEVVDVRYASIRYNQTVQLDAVDGLLLCQANIYLACLNSQLRPRGLPEILSREIKSEHRSIIN